MKYFGLLTILNLILICLKDIQFIQTRIMKTGISYLSLIILIFQI